MNMCRPHCYKEEFEDTKGEIKIRIAKKNRQHNIINYVKSTFDIIALMHVFFYIIK